MSCHSRGLAVGGHDNCFLIVDRVGEDLVVGIRTHTGEVSTVYLMDVDNREAGEVSVREAGCTG